MKKAPQVLFTSLAIFHAASPAASEPIAGHSLKDQVVVAPSWINSVQGPINNAGHNYQTQSQLNSGFLNRFNASSASRLIDYIPGVQTSRNGAGMGEDYTVRGFPLGGRLLLDGVLDNQSHFIRDPATYERLDVIKGQSSAWYGAGVPGGSVNFISKQPEYQPATQITVGVGNDDDKTFVVDSTGPLAKQNQWAYRSILAARQVDREKRHVDSKPLTLMNSVAWRNDTAGLVGTWEYSRQNAPYDFDSVYAHGAPVYGVSYVHPDSYAENTYHRLELQGETQLSSHLRLKGIYRFIDGQREEKRIGFWFMQDEDSPLPGYYREVDEGFNQHTAQLSLHHDYQLGNSQHETALGVAHHKTRTVYDDAVSSYDFNLDIYQPDFNVTLPQADQLYPLKGNVHWEELALFLTQQGQLANNLEMTLSGRMTDYRLANQRNNTRQSETDNHTISYSGGLAWSPAESFTLRASYSRSWLANRGQDDNDNYFSPSQGVQHELGINWQVTPAVLVDAAVFAIQQDNLLIRHPEIEDRFELAGEKAVKGAEINVDLHLNDQWQASIASTYMDARLEKTNDENAGNRFASIPTHQHAFLLHYQPISQLESTVGAVYMGRRPGDRANEFYVGSYTRFDASARWQATPDLSFQASILNLTDIDYVASSTANDFLRLGESRSFRISATQRF
ncbi:TonB-dependent siderophore receptor [Halomonas sp. LS-001]